MIAVSIAIRLTSKGPCFFVQKRVGKFRREFRLYKFRTMNIDAERQKEDLLHLNERDGPAFKMENDPRVTKIGHFLRKHSIDELPQLINVLKGEMSLVGPRPSLVEEVRQLREWHKARFRVTPGLTCLWQIHPDRNMCFDEWMDLDLRYIEERNFLMDLKIILLTIPVVFRGH